MVYIIQCLVSSSKQYSKEKLEEYRKDFMKQINEGCLVLPGLFKLIQVVDDGNPHNNVRGHRIENPLTDLPLMLPGEIVTTSEYDSVIGKLEKEEE